MKLGDIRGLGEKRIQKLQTAGITSPASLILYFPYKYLDLSVTPDFDALKDGDEVAFYCTVAKEPVFKYVRKGLDFVKAEVEVGGKTVSCTWFNQRYVKKQLVVGKKIVISGKIKRFKTKFEISAPQIVKELPRGGKIIPLYKTVKGLPMSVLTEAISVCADAVTVNGYLDASDAKRFNLMPLNDAVKILHFPTDMEKVRIASRSVALENLSYTLAVFSILKLGGQGSRKFVYGDNRDKLDNFIGKLPFVLTRDQRTAIDDIIGSLNGSMRMNRLLQGDVGSGKTVIAFLAMYYAALSGYQSVLMAPTEILAKQHYKTALKLFNGENINVEYLSGAQSAARRAESLFNIKNGVADMVIGTHSVISGDVEFARLSLVITDEQHRFGVAQRGNLENKSFGADSLVMSATPIPRTLALTLYGDLEQSVIKTVPKDKAKILTRIVPMGKISDMYGYIKQDAQKGKRSYLVCARIDDDDDRLVSAVGLYKYLEKSFSDVGIGLLHGQMKDADKNRIMRDFYDGKISVLVTTSVIEVGIDVKEAANMVIFNAERYGLSQLHQLRGRVGRGNIDSYCFLPLDEVGESSRDRLENFVKNSDGFALAEADFETRGAGDFLGTRQHGRNSALGLERITPELLMRAKEICDYVLSNPKLQKAVAESAGGGGEYIKSLTLN